MCVAQACRSAWARGAPDVVYRLDVRRRSRVRVAIGQGEFQGVVYLQRTCGQRSTEIACGRGQVDTVVEAGRYHVVVDGNDSQAFGRYRLTTSIDNTASLEAVCRRATALRSGQTVSGSTGGADRFQASCAQNAQSPETIYKLRLPRRSNVRLDLAAGYDAVLYVRRTCMDATTEVACNDDDVDQNHSKVETTLDAGTYYVFVDGYGTGSSGTYTLETNVTSQ